jgi:NADH-quinone oxidoreductase subunit E
VPPPAAAEKKEQPQPAAMPVAAPGDGAPELHASPKGGKADDLELIWGVGPKLRELLNKMGVWHFHQVASWTETEIRWVDARLEDFKGRIERDDWIAQARKLASGWRPANPIGDKPDK